jgi:adenylosuccinate synthase
MKAFMVAGLGYGDEGKGTITDALTRHHGADLVVRYNGGAQAAHNVVTPGGVHHTFAQFASGTLAGAETFLSRYMVVDPPALLREGEALKAKGISDPFGMVMIDRDALLVHPYHVAINRLRELMRGRTHRHGSTGRGIGEAVVDSRERLDVLRAGHLLQSASIRDILKGIRDAKHAQAKQIIRESGEGPPEELMLQFFGWPDDDEEAEAIFEQWVKACEELRRRVAIVQPNYLQQHAKGCMVFEGAQGMLLDQRYGFHPYTTWSDVTFNNAFELLHEIGGDPEVRRIGVTRAYASRHGPGPFPTENVEWRVPETEHNQHGRWQGKMRFGEFDMFATEYAVHCLGGVDEVAVTCLDHLAENSGAAGIEYGEGYLLSDAEAQFAIEVNMFDFELLADDARTPLLRRAAPAFRECDDEQSFLLEVARRLRAPVAIESWGPTANDKVWR